LLFLLASIFYFPFFSFWLEGAKIFCPGPAQQKG